MQRDGNKAVNPQQPISLRGRARAESLQNSDKHPVTPGLRTRRNSHATAIQQHAAAPRAHHTPNLCPQSFSAPSLADHIGTKSAAL